MPALDLEKQLEAVLYSVSIPQGQCLKSLQLLKILLQGTGSKPQTWTEQHILGVFETRAETKMGLLAIIICCQDKISDVYRELLPLLSEALKSGTATLKMLNCLAIVGFVGSTNSERRPKVPCKLFGSSCILNLSMMSTQKSIRQRFCCNIFLAVSSYKHGGMETQPQLLEWLLLADQPSCLVADMFFPWATDAAAKFCIPRLVFHGTSFFALAASDCVRRYEPFKSMSSD
ncbi:hypothetical protein L3X38_043265 [Prunus dulcis]|uniref:Uncharacterized protein n=1 Tax=Prunus dulcis TaxID=3755 RepID=A0AAD4UXS8_PRUDU|nr:hypothetical protein L3X38_043265 [Prunus dulcis]